MKSRQIQTRTKALLKTLCCGITVLVAIVVWAPNAAAFPDTATCVGCHPIWAGGGGDGHTGHLALGLPSSCNSCHASIGDTPATATCGNCHVVLGLANHHQNSGASSCTGCHPGTPAPENTAVPGYATTTVALDPCDGTEEQFPSLTMSLDNDGDLLYDGDDPDCQPPPESDCSDGVDNDGDGMIDCADQDCAADPACQVPETETDCSDGIDNDEDGMIDCADPDCSADPACQPQEIEDCDDGIDNDGDGMVDCDDPDCDADAACQPPADEICDDGVDNDGDGMIDCDDQDCADDPACQEPIIEFCDDGIDNDGDGFIDCMDPDCATHPACQPPPVEICDDGFDNDEDGMVDCEDPDCSSDPACQPPPSDFAPLRTPFGKCADCHDGFQGGPAGSLHSLHTNSLGASDCMICHGDAAPVCNYCHQVENHDFRKTERGDGHYLHAKEFKLDCKTCHEPGRKDGSKDYDRDDKDYDRDDKDYDRDDKDYDRHDKYDDD